MKICIVINSSWNIYNFRAGLIQSLKKGGHEIVTIAPDDGYVTHLEKLGCRHHIIEIDNKGSNPINDFWLFTQLVQIYAAERPDVILHYTIKPNIYGTFAATMLGIPTINNVTGLGTVFLHRNLTSRIAHKLYRWAFRFPQTVFFQNQEDRDLFVNMKLVRPEITDVLPGSGIDVDKFIPAQTKKNTIFTFLLIARVLYDKGILEYVEAIRLLRSKGIQAKFWLLGKIDTEAGLGIPPEEVAAWEAEGLIEYLGTTDDVISVIRRSDCVLLPSYREGTPRTLLEAASLGKPIIATDVPGCRDTVQHGFNGFLCKVKDPADLAAQMEKMMQADEATLVRMGSNSRKLAVERFDQNIVIYKYQQALASVIAETT
ncbi:glycosyltransferase family 4 protein [Rhodoflexus caldus]|uniref:glycosyltransferase family 4 protein n=1 Tax=Rhodoflexus caldus TaxID=2891236 RepID=UPI002029E1B3|nr:glycosyltransferase family 4 protein [Rhodoflexus caldus]